MLTFHVIQVESLEQPEIVILPSDTSPEAQTEIKNRKYGRNKWKPIRTRILAETLNDQEKKALEIAWEIDVLSAGSIPTGAILQSTFRHGWNAATTQAPPGEQLPLEFSSHTQAAYRLLLKIESHSSKAIAVADLLKKITQAGSEAANEKD